MTQEERNWVFDIAYQFDALRRRPWQGERLVVVMDGADLEKIAERMRLIAERDGEKLILGLERRRAW
jgi:hypothetical protein